MSDPNRDLGPLVEGFVMGLIDQRRLANLPTGWRSEFANDPSGVHALYFVSPSHIRWRIRAEIEDEAVPSTDGPTRPPLGGTT